MTDNYFYAHESNLFTFYRIPKELFSPKFKEVSLEAKVLYGLLLDRNSLSLSQQNNWKDEYGRIYIIFTRNEVQNLLSIGDKTCTKLFKELNDIDLIEEVRQGLRNPNIIYVKKFISQQAYDNPPNQKIREKNDSGSAKSTNQEPTKTRIKDRENNDSGIVKNTIHESSKVRVNNTNTTYTNTTYINPSINLSVEKKERQTDGCSLEHIFEKCKLSLFQDKKQELLIDVIDDLYYNELTAKQLNTPIEIIRNQLSKMTVEAIDKAFYKFKNAYENQGVKNNKIYFAKCLLTAIADANIENLVYRDASP